MQALQKQAPEWPFPSVRAGRNGTAPAWQRPSAGHAAKGRWDVLQDRGYLRKAGMKRAAAERMVPASGTLSAMAPP